MKHIKFIQIVFIVIILLSFSGCVQSPNGTPAPTPTAKPTATVQETIVSTPTIAPTMTPRTPLKYKAYVDESFGFKRVIEITYKEVSYQNLTLTIYTGDNVVWDRIGTESKPILTIISDQGLWANGTARLMNNKVVNYTFTEPGTYTFRIKEVRRILPQTIIVKP